MKISIPKKFQRMEKEPLLISGINLFIIQNSLTYNPAPNTSTNCQNNQRALPNLHTKFNQPFPLRSSNPQGERENSISKIESSILRRIVQQINDLPK